jgi:hypothetical protein
VQTWSQTKQYVAGTNDAKRIYYLKKVIHLCRIFTSQKNFYTVFLQIRWIFIPFFTIRKIFFYTVGLASHDRRIE